MNGRHLVMGTLSDALTGETLADTHDNRYRQKLARLLLDSGLPKTAITKDFGLAICPEERPIRIPIDFVVRMEGHVRLIVRYGPGSIVSRRQPGLAAARLLCAPQVLVTNGEDGERLDTRTGGVLAVGLEIPSPEALSKLPSPPPVSAERKRQCEQILVAFELHDRCQCDTPLEAGKTNHEG